MTYDEIKALFTESAERHKELGALLDKMAQDQVERATEADARSKTLDKSIDKMATRVDQIGNNQGAVAQDRSPANDALSSTLNTPKCTTGIEKNFF